MGGVPNFFLDAMDSPDPFVEASKRQDAVLREEIQVSEEAVLKLSQLRAKIQNKKAELKAEYKRGYDDGYTDAMRQINKILGE
jgi:hypothetical protein